LLADDVMVLAETFEVFCYFLPDPTAASSFTIWSYVAYYAFCIAKVGMGTVSFCYFTFFALAEFVTAFFI
jgi:hypothetical protein